MAILAQAVNHYSKTQVNTLLNLMFGAFSAEHTRRMIDLMKTTVPSKSSYKPV